MSILKEKRVVQELEVMRELRWLIGHRNIPGSSVEKMYLPKMEVNSRRKHRQSCLMVLEDITIHK